MKEKIKAKLIKLLDTNGTEYIGLEVTINIEKYNMYLQKEVENADSFIANKILRDKGQYHITVLSVPQIQGFKKNKPLEYEKFLNEFLNADFEINLYGIGTAIDDKKGNQAWFIVSECESLQEILKNLDFPPKDFHITLAFNKKDVFSQPKGKSSIIYNVDSIHQYFQQQTIKKLRTDNSSDNTYQNKLN